MTADFSLGQLEYFLAVANTGSMSASAVHCHASRAALCAAITDPERRLGAQLPVRRRAKGVFLTEAGTRVLEHAHAVPALTEDRSTSARAERGQLAGRLTIGCCATLSPFLIPPLADGFTRLHPAVDLRFVDGSQEAIRRGLLDGACDLVFLYATGYATGAEAGLTCTTVRSPEEIHVVIAHAATVTPTHRARAFARYARETLATVVAEAVTR
ncbi:LysR substrate-binding domain-containing protein [Streptomyces sp. NPDC012510]|jgi:DNA-binding transcriptional LysR family regulator|uniref:LysR family transcriptional regulator n=1 Tax=Streptomyces sp. NPDC012510 TaxID=3364838 RepID=UPI0036F021BE